MAEEQGDFLKQTIPFDPRFPNQNQTRWLICDTIHFLLFDDMSLNDRVKRLKTIIFCNCFLLRNCWQNYVDFHRCQKIKGEEYEPCQFFYKNFK